MLRGMKRTFLYAAAALAILSAPAFAGSLAGATMGGMVEQQNLMQGQQVQQQQLDLLRQLQQQQQWDRIQQDMQRQNDEAVRQMHERFLHQKSCCQLQR